MPIAFLDLTTQYQSLKGEIDSAIQQVLSSGPLVGGAFVKSFEKSFAAYHDVSHCIATGNGTDSLFAALKMNGIGVGDEVITPAWSWISTSETISMCGAQPVFADVDANSFTISVADIESKLSKKTKAIIAVHLYGQCCDMTALLKLCALHKLVLIEDCAQAHGATQNGKLAGTFGHVGSFSFYPTKNLGALGDAGCLLTSDNDLAIKLRRFVNHGGLTKDEHEFEGINSRMDSIQAAVLELKLTYLKEWNSRRQTIAHVYLENLKGVDSIEMPKTAMGNEHSFHLFVIRSKKRDALKKHLAERGIETLIHYPTALPFERAYAHLKFKAKDFPVAYQLQHEVLSLPCHPYIKDEEVAYICESIRKF